MWWVCAWREKALLGWERQSWDSWSTGGFFRGKVAAGGTGCPRGKYCPQGGTCSTRHRVTWSHLWTCVSNAPWKRKTVALCRKSLCEEPQCVTRCDKSPQEPGMCLAQVWAFLLWPLRWHLVLGRPSGCVCGNRMSGGQEEGDPSGTSAV